MSIFGAICLFFVIFFVGVSMAFLLSKTEPEDNDDDFIGG